MERILGVAADHKNTDIEGQYDVREADSSVEARDNDRSRQRYQVMFWEPVVEGEVSLSEFMLFLRVNTARPMQDPVLPNALQEGREESEKKRQMLQAAKSDPKLLKPQADTPRFKTVLVAPEGRPMLKFVDVGGKFIDVGEQTKRMKESKRRAKLGKKKRDARKGSAKGADTGADVAIH